MISPLANGRLPWLHMLALCLITSSRLISCFAATAVDILTLPIEGRIEMPNSNFEPPTNQEITLNGDQFSTLSRRDGSFTFNDIPSGIYLLDVGSSAYLFPQMKIKISAENATITVVEYKYPGAKRLPSTYPIVLTAMTKLSYFQKRKQLSILGMVTGNPMIILMLIMGVAVVAFPKMLSGMSPEELAEMKKQSASQGDPMKELSKMWGGAGAQKGDDDDEDEDD